MNTAQLSDALRLAKSNEDLSNVDDSVLYGYGLPDFKPVTTTLRVVAKVIRWQTFMLNGEVDSTELAELVRLFRHRVMVI